MSTHVTALTLVLSIANSVITMAADSNGQMAATATALATPAAVPTLWGTAYQQGHQNAGCTSYGHRLVTADCNLDLIADHVTVQTADRSVLAYIKVGTVLGQRAAAGDRLGVQWTLGTKTYEKYLTAQPGDTTTSLAKRLIASMQGGAVAAAVAAAGSGFADGDVVSLALPEGAYCPDLPQFKLAVDRGAVVAAAPLAVGGSKVEGGSCVTDPMPSKPLPVTGGRGSGLTLRVAWGWTDLAAALWAHKDAHGFGQKLTGNYRADYHGVAADWIDFDMPGDTAILVCPGTGIACPTPSRTPLAFQTSSQDIGPYHALVRQPTGRDPHRGDQQGGYRIIGPSTAASLGNVGYAQFQALSGAIASLTATQAAAARPCPCTITVAGWAGHIPHVSPGMLIGDVTLNQAIAAGAKITAITPRGHDTAITFAGKIAAPGVAAGDLIDVIDGSNAVGIAQILAADGGSGNYPPFPQLSCGGVLGGCWTYAARSSGSNAGGDGSVGRGNFNAIAFYANGNLAIDGAGALHPAKTTVAALPTCNGAREGTIYAVTDASAPSWNAPLSGGGGAMVLAMCNGAAWTAH